MRVLMWSVAAFVLFLGVVFLVGLLLPATREGRAEVVIAAPAARIVAVIAEVEAQPEWRAGVAAVERTGDGWVEITARGERISFVAEEMGAARVQLRFGSDAGYSGTWEAVLAPEGEGTRVSVVERAVVPQPLGRILARLFFDPEAFATSYLEALKARVEGI
jgi:hypothetical protein